MGKWLWQCTTTGLDNSTELRTVKIHQAVTEIWVAQVWQPPARPPTLPDRDDNTLQPGGLRGKKLLRCILPQKVSRLSLYKRRVLSYYIEIWVTRPQWFQHWSDQNIIKCQYCPIFFHKICSWSVNYNSFVQYLAPRHPNNHHWIILNWSFRNKFNWILNENKMVIMKNSLETLQHVFNFLGLNVSSKLSRGVHQLDSRRDDYNLSRNLCKKCVRNFIIILECHWPFCILLYPHT